MVNYRRDYFPGGTYFFTLTLRNRKSQLLTDHIHLLGEAFRCVKAKYPYHMDAVVVMPDHLHAVWQLPENDVNYSKRWHMIKSSFTRSIIKTGHSIKPDKRGEYHLWQRRFWEHRIRNEVDYEKHIQYIHFNPVKHGLVKDSEQWPYSSIHRFINRGILESGWGGMDIEGCFGD